MFIKKITIKNFRLFSNDKIFEIDNLNTPDGEDEGSGINLFVGENACGKTTLLDAFALPLLSYKAENFSLNDLNDPNEKAKIEIFSKDDFHFDGTMPKAKYKGKGFLFEAGIRGRTTNSYLSSIIVSDQKYIRADGEEKPKDGSPDLRVNVNNPWKGPRFNENDILFLDKNRTYQIRSGIYSATRFDRLMEDFDYQYIKKGNTFDVNDKLKQISDNVENNFLNEAIEKFNEISGFEVSLSYLQNWNPHKKAFFSVNKENYQQISLESLGSGYEMIFSLLYSFYLSRQSNKQLIVFIDEPELHLHPKLQENFVKILLEFSKTAQIFLTTHSPLLVKQLLANEKISVHCLKKENEEVKILELEKRVLPYFSANEINFLAFDLATEEYHNELYGYIEYKNLLKKYKAGKKTISYKRYKQKNGEKEIKEEQKILSEYIRHQIHHPENDLNIRFTSEQLRESIKEMRSFIKSLKYNE